MKLCQIYNSAAHYREEIFLLIDRTFDCNFVFGAFLGDIRQMDTYLLKGKVRKVENRHLCHGFYWQPKIQGVLTKKYDTFLMLGDTRCLSTWLFCIRARLFHRRKRIFFWSHGWYGKETKVEKFLKKIFFRLPNGGTFLYGNYARELMIKEGLNPDKLFVIHNSLAYSKQLALRNKLHAEDVYQNHFGNTHPNLFFVGRLTMVKKLDMAIKALAKCKEGGHQYNLTFIGDGEAKEELIKLSEELGMTDRVWFYGACYDETELGRMIYNADLCVSPGNVGLTAMHSMVFGTPVITHNDFPHQMPEFEAIHEGVTGSFYEYGNVDSLANNIVKWFVCHQGRRQEVRLACFREIDTKWTPQFQIEVLKRHLL